MNQRVSYIFLRQRLKTSVVIVLIWVVTGSLTAIYEYLFLSNYEGVFLTTPMAEYSLGTSMFAAIIWAFMGGVIFSGVELFYLSDRLENRRFIEVVAIKMLIYSLMLVLLNVITSAIYNSVSLRLPVTHPEVSAKVGEFLTSLSFWHPLLPFILIILLTLFIIQINYKFGTGELWKFITGKYFHPKEELRIFMFLDLNASTTIAEELGHLRFFHYINDFFRDMTNEIVRNQGEIVDYVGDEIIITWDIDKGVNHRQCIKCFYDVKEKIRSLAPVYEGKYGVAPSFKAGVHFGKATIGEIGKIKKEIVFSGDVLNTTSRIQNLCREMGEPLVISEDLLSVLGETDYRVEELGEAQLRGKAGKTKIYTLKE